MLVIFVLSTPVLTCNTGKKLSGKTLDVAVRERHELIPLKKVEDAGPEKISNDTDVIPIVKAIT
jgi:hypothetical protein